MICTWSPLRRERSINCLGYRTTATSLGLVVCWAGILCVALFSGFILGTGNSTQDILLFALLAGILVISLPLESLVIRLFAMAEVIARCTKYFLGVRQCSFMAPARAIIVLRKVFLIAALEHSPIHVHQRKEISSQSILWAVYAYLASMLISLLVDRSSIYEDLPALKFFLPLWSILFAITLGFLSRGFIVRMWRWLVPLAISQLPFTIYQHFVIAPSHADANTQDSADAAVENFGGNPMGRGNSGTLIFFLIAGMVVGLAVSRAGLNISPRSLFVAPLTSFFGLLKSETTAAFLLLPLALIVFDLRLVLSRRTRLPGIGLIGGPALLGLYKAYQLMYLAEEKPSSYAASRSSSPLHHFDYLLDPTNHNLKTGAVDRGAALAIWWTDPQADVHARLISYWPLVANTVSSMFSSPNATDRWKLLGIHR